MKYALSRKNLWERTPVSLKAGVGGALRFVPFTWLLGKRFRQWYGFLQEAQWWDSERYREYQTERVRRIVTLAYERSEYYRQRFTRVGFEPGDFKQLDDLAGLPTIDKETVRANLDRMLTRPINGRSIDYVTTSGTGGTPLMFYMDSSRHAVEFAHLALSWQRVGYRPGDSMAVLRGRPLPVDRAGMYHEYDPLLRHHYYSSFHLTAPQMRRYLSHMHAVRPKFLHAYPSSAWALGRFAAEEHLSFPDSLQAILLESEPCYPFQLDYLRGYFPRGVLTSYGHTEKLVLAAECEHSRLYHVWPTYGHCELLDSQGRAVSVGERGEITGTGFINEVVPFIRYRTDDFASLAGTSCNECGRQHLLLEGIRGHRTQEFLVTHNRTAIVAWTALNMHDDTFDGIMRFQFVQDVPGYAELLLVPAPGRVRYDLNRIQAHLDMKLGGQMTVRLRLCEAIAPSPSGKKPIVIQNVIGIDELLRLLETEQ